jgi:hypothetical protein
VEIWKLLRVRAWKQVLWQLARCSWVTGRRRRLAAVGARDLNGVGGSWKHTIRQLALSQWQPSAAPSVMEGNTGSAGMGGSAGVTRRRDAGIWASVALSGTRSCSTRNASA